MHIRRKLAGGLALVARTITTPVRIWHIMVVTVALLSVMVWVTGALSEDMTGEEKAQVVIEAFQQRGLPETVQWLTTVDEVTVYRVHWRDGNRTGYSDMAGIDRQLGERVWRDYVTSP